MIYNTIIAAIALFASAANAHISLAAPIPYGKPDTSPLSPAGANYPCKTENGFKVNSVTKMSVGQSQKMSFSGTAVHGGGSCQISLATGHTPTGSSQFKVIYSILGGCPGTDGSTTSYDFKVPAEVPAGEYTLAWTWFNRIGNREMYMNCAPITVDGGSGSESSFSGLPDMAIYNIASKNACKTTEGTDVAFPNPGKYVLTGPGNKPGPPTGCGAAAGASSGSSGAAAPAAVPASGSSSGSGSDTGTPTASANDGKYTGEGSSSANAGSSGGSGSVPAAAVPASAPSSAASVSPKKKGSGSSGSSAPASAASAAPASAGSSSTGTFAEGSGSASNGTTGSSNGTTTDSDPSASSAPASLSTPAPAAEQGTPVTPAATEGGACGTDGAVVCSPDGTQFGLCNFGKVVMMPVAAGTKCSGGQISRRHARAFV